MKTIGKALFIEVQSKKPLWLSYFVIGLAVFVTVLAVLQLFFAVRVGTHPVSNGVLVVIWIAVAGILPLLYFRSNLWIAVYPDGIHFRYVPFHMLERVIKKEEIRDFRTVHYNPLEDYGGYGLRLSKKGKAYNVSGNRGVGITTAEGKNILFGSQKPEEFEQALHSIIGGE